MHSISKDNLATLQFELDWRSDVARHKDVIRAEPVNFWRDVLPESIEKGLQGSAPGDQLHFSFPPGQITQPFDSKNRLKLKNQQFERREINSLKTEPRNGRFYPKGLLKGISGVHSNNVTPFNHPLAEKAVELQVTVDEVRAKNGDRGGRLEDWMEVLTNGPGMQGRYNGRATDFFSDKPFVRPDEQDDAIFYKDPRFITHIDSQAQEMIKTLYGNLLQPGMRVLDLMSSWRSHVPESLDLKALVGLGMNREEMADNPQLTDIVVHDVNTDPKLPFEDHFFDAVICTVSVEYMTRPFEVFADVARILKPNGYHIHTFSNRWFPPKAIRLWTELSEFERMGLVLEYYLETGAYRNLQTYSAPVYAVWGQRTS